MFSPDRHGISYLERWLACEDEALEQLAKQIAALGCNAGLCFELAVDVSACSAGERGFRLRATAAAVILEKLA